MLRRQPRSIFYDNNMMIDLRSLLVDILCIIKVRCLMQRTFILIRLLQISQYGSGQTVKYEETDDQEELPACEERLYRKFFTGQSCFFDLFVGSRLIGDDNCHRLILIILLDNYKYDQSYYTCNCCYDAKLRIKRS